MPPTETQKLFLTLLSELNIQEAKVDELRKNLFSQPNFNPYIIFKRFDMDNNDLVTIDNIMKFLEVNCVKYNITDVKTILNFYDTDNLNALNYSNFINLILPDDNLCDNKDEIREQYPLKFVPYPIEYAVCRIFEKELFIAKKINQIKDEIKRRKDFSILGLFLNIRGNNENINSEVLKNYIRSNGFDLYYNDIKRIMKRINICKSGYITIDDLQKFFEVDKVTSSKQVINDKIINDLIRKEEQNNSNIKQFYNIQNSNMQISDNLTLRNIPIRNGQNENNVNRNFEFSNYLNQNSQNSNQNIQNLNNHNININQNTFNNNIPEIDVNKIISKEPKLNICINILKLICETEIQIENQKIELSLREDFNIKDAFNFFCITKKNYITEYDLKVTLNNLGLYPNNDDITLIMKKYDISNNGLLNFIDFFDMLVPFNKEYRIRMEKKSQLIITKDSKVFFDTTLFFLKNFFIFIIESEKKIEIMRQELNKGTNNSVMKLFNEIDKVLRGVFSISDYYQFFIDKFGEVPNGIDLSFIRFDRKRKGEIDWMSFAYEFIPKLNMY